MRRAEGGVDASWVSASTTSGTGLCAGGTGCDAHNTWLGAARAGVGYAWNRLLPCVTGGGESATQFGWAAGAGIEYTSMGAWSVKLEYLCTDLGTATCRAASCGVDTDVTYKANLVRAGLNYRF